jgi:hypothetical protein
MIGGIIVLTLFLTALSTMVFISQQFDAFQTTAENMNQMDIQSFSENLVAVYPGIYGNTTVASSFCTSYCYEYTMLVSNEAAIGTEIARIYINSTYSPGCTNLCVLKPDTSPYPQPFSFLSSTAFVNPSEFSHQVTFYLSKTVALPAAIGSNTITIVTTRGRGFAFQWPFPPTGAPLQTYMAANTMKIAYQGNEFGFNSANEPGAVNSGSDGTTTAGYCHSENATRIVTNLPTVGTLWFVNPWVTQAIVIGPDGAFPNNGAKNDTTFYVYANVTNTQSAPIKITGANLMLEVAGTFAPGSGTIPNYLLVLGGSLLGEFDPAVSGSGSFTSTAPYPVIAVGDSVILIFQVNSYNWQASPNIQPFSGVIFSGTVSMTGNLETGAYFGGTVILDGLYVKASC